MPPQGKSSPDPESVSLDLGSRWFPKFNWYFLVQKYMW